MAESQLHDPLSIVILVIHDGGSVGESWKDFMRNLLVSTPSDQSDAIHIEVVPLCTADLELGEELNPIGENTWKLFLLTHPLLTEIKNLESPLSTTGLLTNYTDKNICLILGDRNDHEFDLQCQLALRAFPRFEQFHRMYAIGSEEIYNELISIVSPFTFVFHPNILIAEDTNQHVTLVGNKRCPELVSPTDHYYRLAFFDKDDRETFSLRPTLFNCTTLWFKNPGHQSGIYYAKLFMSKSKEEETADESNSGNDPVITGHQEDVRMIGSPVRVWFQSDLDRVSSILERSCKPYDFLCEALRIPLYNNPREKVDMCLTDCLERNQPSCELSQVFGTKQSVPQQNEPNRQGKFVPTLLHFACMYGLKNLATALLRCPGSLKAYQTPNCDGDHPINLAEKHGFWDLADYMNDYMVVSAMVDSDLQDDEDDRTADVVSRMVNGETLSSHELESIYGGVKGTTELPGYIAMKPTAAGNGLVQEVHSDEEADDGDRTFLANNIYEAIGQRHIISGGRKVDDYRARTTSMYAQSHSPYGPSSRCSLPEISPLVVTEMPPPVIPPRIPLARQSADADAGGLPPPHPDSVDVYGGAQRKSYRTINNEMLAVASDISPSQQQLVGLLQGVKREKITISQAELRFKEWQSKQNRQASFQCKQERLKLIRDSLVRRKREKKIKGEDTAVKVSEPIVGGSSAVLGLRSQIYSSGYQSASNIYMKTPRVSSNASTLPQRDSLSDRFDDGFMQGQFSANSRSNNFGGGAAPNPADEYSVSTRSAASRPPLIPPR